MGSHFLSQFSVFSGLPLDDKHGIDDQVLTLRELPNSNSWKQVMYSGQDLAHVSSLGVSTGRKCAPVS